MRVIESPRHLIVYVTVWERFVRPSLETALARALVRPGGCLQFCARDGQVANAGAQGHFILMHLYSNRVKRETLPSA